MLFTLTAMPAHAEESATVDASTLTGYESTLHQTSENVGRIWTDKSVFANGFQLSPSSIQISKAEGADFVVGLSALSSASSLTSSSVQPLDIVLVLDVSGSMGDNMGSNTYAPVYTLDQNETYYVFVNYVYRKAVYQQNSWGYYDWRGRFTRVTPKTSADDTSRNHTQFYEQTSSATPKIEALQDAVTNFISATSQANAKISDEDLKNRIALVKYANDSYYNRHNPDLVGNHQDTSGYNYTEIVSGFTSNMVGLQSDVNALEDGGATAADYGMQLAKNLFDGRTIEGQKVRDNAKKVVIFFTDGEPNHSSGFDGDVAESAIKLAKDLKDQGTMIYTIGIFDGADADSLDAKTNRYMQAVSSNYPDATGYSTGSYWGNMGDRVQDGDYYKVASDADALNTIFNDIFTEVSTGSGSPTELEDGFDASKTGYITFTDTLGDFMEVKGTTATLVFGDQSYIGTTTQEAIDNAIQNGGDVTYTFPSATAGTDLYPDGNVQDLKMTVTKSATPKTGDIVKVEVPATLIPVRYYDIEATQDGKTTMKISKAMPIRLFYSVGRKTVVTTAMQGGSEQVKAVAGLEDYIKDNTGTTSNQVYFYSNAFTKNASAGMTTANFTPNQFNSFYSFQEDTPVYQDANGATRVTSTPKVGDKVYYPVTYYSNKEGETKQITSYVAVTVTQEVLAHNFFRTDADGVVITQDSPKITKPASFAEVKTVNATGTADNAVEPSWDSAYDQVNVALGNNGRIAAPAPTPDPVTISEETGNGINVKKTVTGAANAGPFEFKLTLKSAMDGTTAITDGVFTDADATKAFPDNGMTLSLGNFAAGDSKTGTFDAITFTKEGTYTFTVNETTAQPDPANGWTYDTSTHDVTVTVTKSKTENKLEATVAYAAGADTDATAACFTNRYEAAPVTLGEGAQNALSVTKKVTGADAKEAFSFELKLTSNNAANVTGLDSKNTMTAATSASIKDGGSETVTFGDLTFKAEGTYTFEVKETTTATANSGWTYDNTPKTITVTVTDEGNDGQLDAVVTDNNPTFTNSYSAGAGTLNGADKLKVSKAIEGRGWLESDQFTFKLTNTGKPDGVAEAPMPTEDTLTLNYANRTGAFGNIQFAVPGIYTYTISETDSTAQDLKKDSTVYIVTVNVEDNGSGTLQVESSMTPGSDNVAAFTNTYNGDDDPKKDVTVNDETTSGNGSLVGVGDELTYTIDWTNTAVDEKGNAVTATVTVTDPIPAGTELVEVYNDGSNDNGTIKWTIADAAPHAKGTVSFKVRVTEDAVEEDTISNTASVKVGNDDPTTSNTVENNFPKKEDITQPAVTEIHVGDELTYQISFHNKEAGTVEVVDTLAQGLEYVKDSALVNNAAVEPTVDADKLTWNVPVTAGSDTIITFRVKVTRDALVTVDNKATVGGHTTNTVTTPVPTDDAKHVSKNGVQVDGQLVEVGDTLTYTIDWANDGETDGTVTIVDTLPNGLAVKADTISNDGVYDETAKTITWMLTNVQAGKRGTVRFEAEVTAEALNGTIENTATVNNHAAVSVINYVNTKTVEEPADGVKVGSELTYTIEYANATDAAATVIVTDKLSEGLTYVNDSANVEPTSAENNTIVWTIENVPAKSTDTITFKAVVNEKAVQDTIENKATVKVGDNPTVDTNTTETTLGTGSLAISKTVNWAETGDKHEDQKFSFQVILTDSKGNALTGEYKLDGTEDTVKSGDSITLTDGETKTIVGLPEGTKYTVTETQVTGYKAKVQTISGEITEGTEPAAAAFVNTYTTTSTTVGDDGDTMLTVHKNFIGRDWTDGDSFSFTLSAAEGDTAAASVLSEPETITIKADTENYSASFSPLTFKQVGDYTFTVQEVIPSEAVDNVYNGITYDTDVKTLLIHVIDNGDGTLSADLDPHSDSLTFTNSYDANFPDPEDPDNPGVESGLVQIPVSKEMTGDRTNLLDGESYDFAITPNTDKSTVASELIPEADNSTLTLDKYTPTDLFAVDFSVVHEKAEALMNQAMNGSAASAKSAYIATAESAMATSETAAADSDASSNGLSVDSLNVATMSLEDIQTLDADQAKNLLDQICGDYYYTIAESSTEMGGGVTKDLTTYEVKITMKHDGAGTLYLEKPVITKVTNSDGSEIAEAERPQVETAAFVNTYTLQNDTVSLSITGSKELTGRALEKGEFTFVLQDATTGEIVAQTTNEVDGSFTFDLSYTKDQIRKYGYTVTEVVGSDAQITYDKTSYAVQVNVYDDNNGNLKAEATLPESGLVFRNTYTAPAQEQEETPTTPKPTPVPSAAPTATPAPASVIPQTGDNFPYALLIVLLCAAAAGFGIAFYANKRKNKH